jgi:hypothetical protein
MKDPAATIRDIARAIEHLSAIRVRQLANHRDKGSVAPLLDSEAQDVRNQIVQLAEALPVARAELDLDDNASRLLVL